MYCSECGRQASGKFCCHCGTALAGHLPPGEVSVDWEDSLDYHVVASEPEVQTAIAQARSQCRQKVSGNQLLQVTDKIATPWTGGVSSLTIAKFAQPFYARLGLKTGKQRSELLPLAPGRALARVLVALARKGNEVVDVEQHADTCKLTAALPADLRGMQGQLTITLRRQQPGTSVDAQALIEGQWYDWGKCRRGLDELFQSFHAAA